MALHFFVFQMQVKPVNFFFQLLCFSNKLKLLYSDLTLNKVWICSCYRLSWISNRPGKFPTQNVNVTNLTSCPFAVRSSSSTFGERCQRLSCPMSLCTQCVESQLSYCWGCAWAKRLKVSLERAQFLALVSCASPSHHGLRWFLELWSSNTVHHIIPSRAVLHFGKIAPSWVLWYEKYYPKIGALGQWSSIERQHTPKHKLDFLDFWNPTGLSDPWTSTLAVCEKYLIMKG